MISASDLAFIILALVVIVSAVGEFLAKRWFVARRSPPQQQQYNKDTGVTELGHRPIHAVHMDERPAPTIRRLDGPSEMLPFVQSFVDLSRGTEFGMYLEPQWRLLLNLEEVTAFVAISENRDPAGGGKAGLDGCVLKLQLAKDEIGYGFVLVRRSKRGQGLARKLMETAMSSSTGKCRHVLAVCSALGQPLYRKLGYKEAGRVTYLSCSIGDMLSYLASPLGAKHCVDTPQMSQGEVWEQVKGKPNSLIPTDRLKVLSEGKYSSNARTSSAIHLDSFAIARQDCRGGTFIVGPMVGEERYCLTLIHQLIKTHFRDANKDDDEYARLYVQMMIPDHFDLVQTLMSIEGMVNHWQSPCMTSDGKPLCVANHTEHRRLMYMHPTLG